MTLFVIVDIAADIVDTVGLKVDVELFDEL